MLILKIPNAQQPFVAITKLFQRTPFPKTSEFLPQ